jgi:hypothetical protein
MENVHVQVLPLKVYLDEGAENIVPDRLRTGTPNSRFYITIKSISFKRYFRGVYLLSHKPLLIGQ